MVSTRGVKFKFFEGERVLCYEPDPTKAKVLYDSKVLGIIVKKDGRGKKFVEYMIHFQGWNSSWDRSVSEEYVLKDTPENRQLQRDLAEKSQLQIGAYLYRKERKKHNRPSGKSSEKATHSSEDGSCGSPTLMEDVDGNAQTSTSEEESSAEEDTIIIELNQTLKEFLEADYNNVKVKNKLHKLPCDLTVVQILEEYWKYYATKLFNSLNEKTPHRGRPSYHNGFKLKPEDIQRKLHLCKEYLDGLRVYFDFTVNTILLYSPEDGQMETAPTKAVGPSGASTSKAEGASIKSEVEDQEYAHLPIVEDDDNFQNDMDSGNNVASGRSSRRRTLRSNKSCDSNSNGAVAPESSSKSRNNAPHASNNVDLNGLSIKIPIWKAVPEAAYTQSPPPPCLVYGVTHLLRLFVKLPDLLSSTTISDERLKIILDYSDNFLAFITGHKDWLENVAYIDA